MKTLNGIYLDLNESDYTYNFRGFRFYFSSQCHLNKFIKLSKTYIKEENLKILIKYGVNVDMTEFLLISLYRKIENRGFKIYDLMNKKDLTNNLQFTNYILIH